MAMAMCSAGAAPAAAARIVSRPVEAWRSPAGATVSGGGGGSVARLCSSFIGLSLRTRQENVRDIIPAPNAPAALGKLCVTVSKMKTHKATAKRFRVTGSGKIMRRRAFRQHLLSKKSQRRKRRLAGMVQVKRSDYNNIIGALPYLNVKGRVN